MVDLVHKSDDLDVYQRVVGAQNLGAYLDMLAVAALLLALMAEHRPQIPELQGLGELVQSVLDVSAHHPGGPLGPQRQLPTTLVMKDEHLLAHYVRRLAYAPDVQRRLLEGGQPHLRIVVPPKKIVGDLLDPGPELRPFVRLSPTGIDVVGALRPLVDHRTPKGRYGFVSSSSKAFKTGPCP